MYIKGISKKKEKLCYISFYWNILRDSCAINNANISSSFFDSDKWNEIKLGSMKMVFEYYFSGIETVKVIATILWILFVTFQCRLVYNNERTESAIKKNQQVIVEPRVNIKIINSFLKVSYRIYFQSPDYWFYCNFFNS